MYLLLNFRKTLLCVARDCMSIPNLTDLWLLFVGISEKNSEVILCFELIMCEVWLNSFSLTSFWLNRLFVAGNGYIWNWNWAISVARPSFENWISSYSHIRIEIFVYDELPRQICKIEYANWRHPSKQYYLMFFDSKYDGQPFYVNGTFEMYSLYSMNGNLSTSWDRVRTINSPSGILHY